MDEREYIASLEQGMRLLMEQNIKAQNSFKQLQMMYESVVDAPAWKLTWPVRYVIEKLKKTTFYTEFPNLQDILAKAPKILPVKISVIVPAFQGEKELPVLLESIQHQQGIREIECIVAVTQSTDATYDVAQQYGAKVIPVSRQAFSHSAARNLGAQHAQGELLLFTVQDACFHQSDVLYKMAGMVLYGEADAVSCRQVPNQVADLMARYEVHQAICTKANASKDHIDSMRRAPRTFHEWEPMLYIDDVAHLTKKSVWAKHPFHGNFAEDILYAADVLRAGGRTGMLHSAQVCHSHTRGAASIFWRAYQAGTGLLENWGKYLSINQTFSERTAAQEAALFYARLNGVAWLYEREQPFLAREEASYVVLQRMRSVLQSDLPDMGNVVFSDDVGWESEEQDLTHKLYTLAQTVPKVNAVQQLAGTLGEIENFFVQEKVICLDKKGKTDLFSLLIKLTFQYTGHALAFAKGSKETLPQLLDQTIG